MTTRRPSSRKAEGDTPEDSAPVTCSHDAGELVAYEGTNPHKAGRRLCALCGCAYDWTGAHVALGGACPQTTTQAPVAPTDPPVTDEPETPTEPEPVPSGDGADGGRDAGEGAPASS